MSTIRPFAGEDLTAFSAVHGADRNTPRRSRTFVANVEGLVIGAATALWSRRHPDFIGGTIEVAKNHRRRGIGSALLLQLDNETDRPLMFNVVRTPTSSAFLDAHNYTIAATSLTARVSTTAALATLEQLSSSAPASIRIEAPDELGAPIIQLYEQAYAERHRWAGSYNPLQTLHGSTSPETRSTQRAESRSPSPAGTRLVSFRCTAGTS